MQKRLLDHIRPESDGERDAFSEWLRSALRNLEHSLWRRCQRELSDVMYRFIVENDNLRTKTKAPCQSLSGPPSQSGNYGQITSANFCQNQSNQTWQPGPQYWPASVQNPTSVWGSMDSSWVQQQFPGTQFTSQPRNQPSESTTQFSSTSNQLQRAQSAPPTTQFNSTPASSQMHFSSIFRDIQGLDDQDSNSSAAGFRRSASTETIQNTD